MFSYKLISHLFVGEFTKKKYQKVVGKQLYKMLF